MCQELPERNQILPAATVFRDVGMNGSVVIKKPILVRKSYGCGRYDL